MSQRINISVPDELYQKMQIYKERLNISRICQSAIRNYVMIEELYDQKEDRLDEMAIRFKKEREEYGKPFYEEGFKDGTNDGLQCDFQWMYTIWTHRFELSSEELFDMGCTKSTRQKVENEELETDLDFFVIFDHIKDIYFDGWVMGFFGVWERVAKKINLQNVYVDSAS